VLSLFLVNFVVCCPVESSGVASALGGSVDLAWACFWFNSLLEQHVRKVEVSSGCVVSSCWFVVALILAMSICCASS